jgi:ATP-binding cassette subfamily B protein
MPKPTIDAGKAKNTKLAFKTFVRSLKRFRLAIFTAIFLTVVSAITGLFTPKLLGEMTDIAKNTLATGLDWNALGEKALIAILLFVISGLLTYISSCILTIVTAKYTRSLRNQVIDKISRLPISYFDTHKFGDVLSRMSNDIDVIAMTMHQVITDLSFNIITIVGVIIIMAMTSVPLLIISVVTVLLSIIVVGKIAGFAQKYFREQQATLGVLNSKIEENYSGQIVIKSNSHETETLNDFDKTNKKLARTAMRAQVFSMLAIPVTHIFTNLGYVVTCIVGGYFVLEGRISLGNIQAFIQYVTRFNRPINEVASSTATIQSLLAAAERVFEFTNETEEPADEAKQTIEKVKGAVEFHHVNFSYDKKRPIIKDFSAKILPGQQVAIVGPTGAGKTTIINLLMRFYEPDSGYITIDDTPINELSRAEVRGLFGMVLQDTWLFSGTIAENLKYGNPDATDEDVKKAAKISNVHHVIESLPHAYQTVINEDSDNISAGEKQLLTVARVVTANPPMLILDEATSNVDTRTEHLVQAAFEKITKGRTSFVIAHRLSTIRNADLILVMKDGNIIEQGNHDELLKKHGFYAELYNSQFKED